MCRAGMTGCRQTSRLTRARRATRQKGVMAIRGGRRSHFRVGGAAATPNAVGG